jgi:hypothetical protein
MPQFTDIDWDFLQQLEVVLQRFFEHTEHVSRSAPQISYAVPIYYDLHELLNNAASQEGEFLTLHADIAAAVNISLQQYQKYYDFMDGLDIYYIALTLNPRYKSKLLEQELGVDGNAIVENIKAILHSLYPGVSSITVSLPSSLSISQLPLHQSLEARLLSKIQQPSSLLLSDIDRYFNDPLAQIPEDLATDPDWLFKWWRNHKDEYPRMAAAARDYLAVPASEVSCERLFSAGRDLIGLRRHSLHPKTMRQLALLRHSIRAKLKVDII